jgi:hypothetical protein
LKNSKSVEIKKFSFINSESTQKYDVRNIELDLHFSEVGEEKITELQINFKNNQSKTYKIGDWYFNVENKESIDKSPIEMGNDYALVSNFFDGYMVNLVNNSTEYLKLIDC